MDLSCPICGTPVAQPDEHAPGADRDPAAGNRFRPFCSRRCQLVDLGRWLGEEYAIPGEPADLPDNREPADDPARHRR